MNLFLGEGNSISLLRFVRDTELARIPRMIGMSKQAKPESVIELRQLGVKKLLLKPFPLEEAWPDCR